MFKTLYYSIPEKYYKILVKENYRHLKDFLSFLFKLYERIILENLHKNLKTKGKNNTIFDRKI